MERIRNRWLEIVLGLALSAVLVLGVMTIWWSFRGNFSDKITVSAELAKAGDALEQGDIVTYRSVIIGEVTDSTGTAEGGAVAELKIDPHAAAQIPANVTAVAVPASLFGNTKIELLPPTSPAAAHLVDKSVISADRSPTAESLQTALENAYTLLTSVHPAQLDAALSALATALQGQGANINTLIGKADSYLARLAPHLPKLDDVISSLADVTEHLARNAPDLLDSLANTLVISRGILADKQVVHALLDVAPTAVDNTRTLLNRKVVDNAVTVITNEVPVSAALAAHPGALADTLLGFRVFADTFNQTLASGPFLKANLLLTGADFTKLFPAAAGQKGDVFHAIVNPPEYTNADCPRYEGASGPNCTSAARSSHVQVMQTGHNFGGTSSSVGSARESRAVRSAASAITHLPVSELPAGVVDVLLGPLLRGVPTLLQAAR
ncbi:MAG: phospholipid/cholesterol/gamma-HCH transport system substrate-binding protein [Pseudonocardiales bacterium]|jgi:virulence factor Mce-like protein|nr:phospholipid/cholesterol/gamma-HCH transport system substrate-binding protein [Pseudonocardiales bacterium]